MKKIKDRERSPQISIDPKLYDVIVQEANKNKRTIKGQTELMLEMALESKETEIAL